MHDAQGDIAKMQHMVAQFVDEREWGQFHTPKNLSIDIAVEAAELMEIFMWATDAESVDLLKSRKADIEDECADVLIGLLAFVNAAQIDLISAFMQKLEKTKAKYPVEKVRGNAAKYHYYAHKKM